MTKKKTVAEYISGQIDLCGKSQKQIAEEVGFPKANILTMIKHGTTRVPIHRAPALARALGVDPAKLMRMALAEYSPEILEAIEGSLGPIVVEPEK
jgi:transcriptional regulator with XRE-family HTH domain